MAAATKKTYVVHLARTRLQTAVLHVRASSEREAEGMVRDHVEVGGDPLEELPEGVTLWGSWSDGETEGDVDVDVHGVTDIDTPGVA